MSENIGNDQKPCPACGNSTWVSAGKVKDHSISGEWFELESCPVCLLKRTSPQPAPDEIGRYYASEDYVSHSDTRSGIINKLYHAARILMLKKKHRWVLKASGQQTGYLLDVGAGTGHFPYYMKMSGWHAEGLEPDETARRVASEKLNMPLDPIEKLDTLPENQYDVITLWHVLEHVHGPGNYFDRFRKILKPGGVLIIAVPNHTSRDAKKYKADWAAYDVPRHLWHFSPESMQKLMEKNGFSLAEKLPMHLDAFYVSMLSEKYRGRGIIGLVSAFFSGVKTYWSARKNVDTASSVIYIAK